MGRMTRGPGGTDELLGSAPATERGGGVRDRGLTDLRSSDISSDFTKSIFPAKSTAPVDESSDPVCEDTCLYCRSDCARCSCRMKATLSMC